MSLIHYKYHKIHTSLEGNNKNKKYKSSSSSSSKWCVTEKIHGSNFSIYITKDGEIKCSKRTSFINDNDNFFNYIKLIEKIRFNLLQLSQDIFLNNENNTSNIATNITTNRNTNRNTNHIDNNNNSKSNNELNYIIIYGELFGGSYPNINSDISQPIQQGIWYSPNIEYGIFDICYEINNIMQFIPYSKTIELAEKYNLFVIKPLFIGTYQEACQYDIVFQSTIPSLLSLPLENLSGINNQAEGIVIREYNTYNRYDEVRPMIKIKSFEFSEGEGCPPQGNEYDSNHLKTWIFSLLNWNRITSAISKVGSPIILTNRELIIQEVVRDIQEESGFEDELFQEFVDELKFTAHNLLARNLSS